MRPSARVLLGCLLLAVAPCLAAPADPTAPARRPGAGVDFEDERLADADRQTLSKAARLVATWAMVQSVVQTVAKDAPAAVSIDRVKAIDDAWRKGDDPDGLVTSIARNECSQALQRAVSANPSYAGVYVTDTRGVVVCMTDRSAGYFHGEEPSFARALAGGTGAIFVSRAGPDAGGLVVVQIAVPVRSAGQVIGVLVAERIAASG